MKPGVDKILSMEKSERFDYRLNHSARFFRRKRPLGDNVSQILIPVFLHHEQVSFPVEFASSAVVNLSKFELETPTNSLHLEICLLGSCNFVSGISLIATCTARACTISVEKTLPCSVPPRYFPSRYLPATVRPVQACFWSDISASISRS